MALRRGGTPKAARGGKESPAVHIFAEPEIPSFRPEFLSGEEENAPAETNPNRSDCVLRELQKECRLLLVTPLVSNQEKAGTLRSAIGRLLEVGRMLPQP